MAGPPETSQHERRGRGKARARAASSGRAPSFAKPARRGSSTARSGRSWIAKARERAAAQNRRAFHRSEPKWTRPSAKPTPSRRAPRHEVDELPNIAVMTRPSGVCIHCQADQKPSAAPTISSGAEKKMPVPKSRSSQRPANSAEQRRRDDGPAEHADLAETRAKRRLGIASPSWRALGGDGAPPRPAGLARRRAGAACSRRIRSS